MYTSIRVKEFDLLSFFESNPSFIGEEAAGECRYIYVRDNFKISIFISIYEMCVSVYIGYNNNVLYREKIDNIVEISKVDEVTLRIVGLLENIILKKFQQISAIIVIPRLQEYLYYLMNLIFLNFLNQIPQSLGLRKMVDYSISIKQKILK